MFSPLFAPYYSSLYWKGILMKFEVDRREFLNHLNIINRAISLHSPKPILCGVYISMEKDGLRLIGSEPQLSIESFMYPTQENGLKMDFSSLFEEGTVVNDVIDHAFVAEARYLLEIIRKMEARTIVIELLDGNTLQITGDRDLFKLRYMPAQDYPMPNFQSPPTNFTLKAFVLHDIVEQVSFAASEKDFRAVLLGVHFESSNGKLICSATDSYRLAKKTIDIEDLPDFTMTIPTKCLNEVTRSLSPDASVIIRCSNKIVQFLFDDNLIQSQLYEGTYPDVDKIIPREYASELDADSSDLQRKLDLSTIYATESVSVVRMELSDREVLVTSSSKEVGSSDQYLDDARYEGNPLAISYNGRFMLQALRGLKCKDRVKMQFISEVKPIRITNPEDSSLEMIVVPLRTHQ